MVYLHGQGGNAGEAEHFRPLLPDYDVIGFDYQAGTPWEAKKEFPPFFEKTEKRYRSVSLIANSIGAFFAMQALSDRAIAEAFFISPVVDMEKLILSMMASNGVTGEELREKKRIVTPSGEITWEYLVFARENPVKWRIPTKILYGEKDGLTSFETVSAFAEETGAILTVMPGGEHWFHTPEQMAFLDRWILSLPTSD